MRVILWKKSKHNSIKFLLNTHTIEKYKHISIHANHNHTWERCTITFHAKKHNELENVYQKFKTYDFFPFPYLEAIKLIPKLLPKEKWRKDIITIHDRWFSIVGPPTYIYSKHCYCCQPFSSEKSMLLNDLTIQFCNFTSCNVFPQGL